MSFFSRLFSRLSSHNSNPKSVAAPTVEERIAALDTQTPDDIKHTVNSDAPEALRVAAVAKLEFDESLKALALETSNQAVSRAAQIRLGQLFDSNAVSLNQLIDGADTTEQQLLLTQASPQASVDVIEKIHDQSALAQLASSATVANVRLAAAEKITEQEHLHALLKSSKGKDKAIYKIAKTKLDQHKADAAKVAEFVASSLALCESAERLYASPEGPQKNEKLDQLQRRWNSLNTQAQEHIPAEHQQRYQNAADEYKQRLQAEQAAENEHIEAEKVAAEQQQAQALQQQAQEQDTLQAVADSQTQVQKLLSDIYNSDNFSATTVTGFETALKLTRNLIGELPENTLKMSAVKQFNRCHNDALRTLELCAELEQNSSSLQALTAQLTQGQDSEPEQNSIDKNAAPNQLAALLQAATHISDEQQPATVIAARAALQTYRDQQQAEQKQQDNLRRQLSDLLRRGLHAVNDNNLRRVSGISRDVEKLVPQLQPLPAGMAAKVTDLSEGLSKLRDWHNFATEPKKQELLTQMEALADSPLHPTDLASRVQQLQEEWKNLSRGSKSQDEELWQAFQNAANIAYAPCNEHFDDQAKLREENRLKRETLLEQLQTYIDSNNWDSESWSDDHCKAVEQLRKLAREEWRRYSPVSRHVNLALQKTFEQHLDHISNSIDTYFEAGKKTKLALVTDAEKSANSDDNAQAIDTIKRLQAQWKNAGRCNRKDEKVLWSDFRGHCDTVFSRRDEQSNAQRAVENTNLESVEPILAAMTELLPLDGQAFLNSSTKIEELSTQFYAVGDLPRASRGKISAQFRQLQSDLNAKVERARQQVKDQAWQAVFTASDRVREYEWQNIEADSAQEALNAATENASGEAKAVLQTIAERLQAPATTPAQQQANTQALELLCIQAEILCEQETPAQYKAERMAFQMAQLKQGLGQSEQNTMSAYTLQWLATGASTAAEYNNLWQRFDACRQA